MGDVRTKCISVLVLGKNQLRINDNELLTSGDYNSDQIEKAFSDLKKNGWNIVATIDRKPVGNILKGLDIYFRKEFLPGALSMGEE